MATITVRNLNDETKTKLRQLAAQHGHSMEEEVRRILSRAVNQADEKGLGTLISQQFEAIGGVELEIPPRSYSRQSTNLFDDES
jgi:plasmid stability protein